MPIFSRMTREQRLTGRDLAGRLTTVGPRASLWLRLRGVRACKGPGQELSLHLSYATGHLRRYDLSKAELELRAALTSSRRCEQGADLAAVRSAVSEVLDTVLQWKYEGEVEAATAATRSSEVASHLQRARAIAVELGNAGEVEWVEEMLQGPRLHPATEANPGAGGAPSRSADPKEVIAGYHGSTSRVQREGQREQFRRVARDSRAYASKRLRPLR